MHRKLLFALIAAIAIVAAGCGGGGGGGSTTVAPVLTSYAGTWSLPAVSLPSDRLFIASTGEVFVYGETPLAQISSLSAANYPTLIGECDLEGGITFNGEWTLNGALYGISGSGYIDYPTQTINTYISITRAGSTIIQNTNYSGTVLSTTPPVLPVSLTDDGMNPPPPPTLGD